MSVAIHQPMDDESTDERERYSDNRQPEREREGE
jgi:hypothetical protein